MKSLNSILIGLFLIGGTQLLNAQGYQYSEQFGTDVWTGYEDHELKIINCSKGSGNAIDLARCMREDGQNGFNNPSFIQGQVTNTSGLYRKVARGIAAQRPKGTSTTSSSGSRRAGTSYNYQTSDQHQQWLADKRARDEEARRRAAEKKRWEALQRKIAEDNRAAAVTAQTNAMLQQQTDRRIQSDYYNANEGAYLAQQRARNAQRMVGPQFAKNDSKTSGQQKAQMLKRKNKPRRIMYPQRLARNTTRRQLPKVNRQAVDPERVAMLQKALAVQAELRRKKAKDTKTTKKSAMATVNYGRQAIVLGPHAHSTLGKDWNTEPLTTPPPPPIQKPKMTDDERINVFLYEFFGASESNLSAKEFEKLLETKEI